MKICTQCKQLVSYSGFHKDKQKKDGFAAVCKSCKKNYAQTRYQSNPDPAKQRSIKQRVHSREQLNQYKHAYRRRNPEYYNKKSIEYYRLKAQATPKWLTDDHRRQMQNIKQESKELTRQTGVSYVVDHIIPIQGENVSGLNVPWNLQILTNSANSEKSNKVT